jgi:N-acyl amino acid synthase of PEP-CTERM/exosortase system
MMKKQTEKKDLLTPYFQFRKVDVNDLEEMFKLRYEVYCIEREFLSADNYVGLESDEYDEYSTHFGGYNMGNLIVGTARLVQPPKEIPFPFETHCSVFKDFIFPLREQSSEISRLVVRKTYRRRYDDSPYGVSKRDKPLLLIGLYREMYRHSRDNGVRYWYAAMESSLALSLCKMGFKFVPIGPSTDYYGSVTPFIADLNELNETLKKENQLLSAWFNDEPISLWLRLRFGLMVLRNRLINWMGIH